MGPELLLAAKIGGTILSTVSQVQSAGAQEDIANTQARLDTANLEAQIAREQAQAAREARNREERLRQNLSRQRAMMGGIVDLSSGTPLRFQELSVGASNRAGSEADFITNANITNLNVQKGNTEINRIGSVNAAKEKKTQAIGKAISGIGGTIIGNGDLF